MIPYDDNFIRLSIELQNQSKDLREKTYHALMRELFSTKAFRDASSQDGLISVAEYLYRYKIDARITDFITQMGQGKKGWISCDITPSDNYGKSGRFA
jgi:hypothetical protein